MIWSSWPKAFQGGSFAMDDFNVGFLEQDLGSLHPGQLVDIMANLQMFSDGSVVCSSVTRNQVFMTDAPIDS